ncbi:MAG: hypothetical protein ACLTSK_00815 [Christensenellales bacterium]
MQVVNMHKAGLIERLKRSFMRQTENSLQYGKLKRIGYEFRTKVCLRPLLCILLTPTKESRSNETWSFGDAILNFGFGIPVQKFPRQKRGDFQESARQSFRGTAFSRSENGAEECLYPTLRRLRPKIPK